MNQPSSGENEKITPASPAGGPDESRTRAVQDESGQSRLKEMRIKHAKQQLKLDRLGITLDKIKRYIVERDAEIAVEIRRANPKMPEQVVTDEVTNRMAKDDVSYRKAKYLDRLRRRAIKLIYEQSLLSAEIEYLAVTLKH